MNCRFIFRYPLKKRLLLYPLHSSIQIFIHGPYFKNPHACAEEPFKTKWSWSLQRGGLCQQTLSFVPAQSLRAQGGFVGLSPGGAALPQRDCLLQSLPDFFIQCSRIIATGLFSVRATYFPSEAPLACTWGACGASAWPHQCFPCFGACRWLEGNFWISAHQWVAEKEEQAHGLLLEQQHLMRVSANLWPLLAFYFFFIFSINTLKRQLWYYCPIERY